MSESIKVSVIVPIFNAEKWLERTLDALAAQTLEEIEILLVDDGSRDGSAAICRRYAGEDPRFVYIRQDNAGVSAARNAGMQAARGEYLMFCDADDLPASAWAEKLYNKASKEKADIALCGFVKESGGVCSEEPLPYEDAITRREEIIEKLIMPMCVWGYASGKSLYGSVWRGAYRRTRIESSGLHFLTGVVLGEDLAFNVRAFEKSNKMVFVSECLYTYVENQTSATHICYDRLWRKYLVLWKTVHEQLTEITASPEEAAWHNYQLGRYAVSAIIEGVCSQSIGRRQKIACVRAILSEAELKEAMKNLPEDLTRRKKWMSRMLRPIFAELIFGYYQRACKRSKE